MDKTVPSRPDSGECVGLISLVSKASFPPRSSFIISSVRANEDISFIMETTPSARLEI